MSATIARQGSWVQLEQSDMRLGLNIAKMAIGAFLHTAIEDTQHVKKKPQAGVQEEGMCGVEFLGY